MTRQMRVEENVDQQFLIYLHLLLNSKFIIVGRFFPIKKCLCSVYSLRVQIYLPTFTAKYINQTCRELCLG